MTEVNIDAYFSKLQDIKTLCETTSSTLIALTSDINDLLVIMNDIDTDIGTMAFPTTPQHLQKFILCMNDRCSLINLQNILYEFINLRVTHLQSIIDIGTATIDNYNTSKSYSDETESIKTYINGLKETFTPMKVRDSVVSFMAKS